MVKVKEDLTGKRFGQWMVLGQAEDYISPSNGKHCAMWLCKCNCKYGTIAKVRGGHLTGGKSTRCKNCYRDECADRFIIQNKEVLPENLRFVTTEEERIVKKNRERIHTIWRNMWRRCTNINDEKYARYGGRGISICDEWKDVDAFYDWAINNGYQENLSIDRIDNDGNYEPHNCRWVDDVTQANNKSTNFNITFNGETHTLQEWSRITGIDRRTIYKRIEQYGWQIKDALTKPTKPKRDSNELLIEFQQEKHTLSEWARKLNISRGTLKSRFAMGWSVERTFTAPVNYKNKEG